jgi:16S rRNA (cytidine1402-2'-O)-methyltransferase
VVQHTKPGRLDVVATPIGNLDDLSPRARAALAAADVIAAEDTRRTLQLLSALGISTPLVALHEHNEREQAPRLIDRMLQGEQIALVSDAGTPLLSDPGHDLVAAAVAAGLEVRPIPGPTAIAALLSASGLPTARFAFEGFLPAKSSARQAALRALQYDPRTLVFFEAPHRLSDSLADLRDILGAERPACIGRELTKLYETLYRGNLTKLAALSLQDKDISRGEISIAVAGNAAPMTVDAGADPARLQRAAELLAAELPPSRAAAVLAELFDLPRKLAYERILALGGKKHGVAAETGEKN